MKIDAKKINRIQKRAYKSSGKLLYDMRYMYHLIMPYVENDTEVNDDDIIVDYLAGDGFSFMIGEAGVSVNDMIGRIDDLKKGDKIKLSEIRTYL